ncbi:ATP-binding protein [Streptomyces sp. L7]
MQPSGIALKASAVAPVALAVAELLDNAASFSQADAPIEVTFRQAQKNLCIVIDDAGVGMGDEDRQRASAMLSGEGLPRLSQLGTQPKFGFPVIGLIARQHGFTVDVTGVSRYGGVRAVVTPCPEELWTMEETLPPATEAPREHHPADGDRTVGAYGGRSAEAWLPVSRPPVLTTGGEQAPRRSARRGTGSLAALQRGTQSARDTASFDIPTPGGSENA